MLSSSLRWWKVRFIAIRHEERVFLLEAQRHGAGRTVAVFSDNELGLVRLLRLLLMVVAVAIKEGHDIGLRFKAAAVAQVGQHRPLVAAGLDTAVELCERNDRDGQVFGRGL